MRTNAILLVIIATMTMIFTSPMNAATTAYSAETIAQQSVEMMQEQLELTHEQNKQCGAIILKYVKKNLKLRQSNASRKATVETMKKDEAARREEIKAVLTPTQYDKWVASLKK